jgi:NAD(P)-dependent dehydrogenase (short-subunit alcohol dehydrogenase family)
MATVLVTGANRGLGLEFVRQYAADGWVVKAAARDPEKSKELKKFAEQHKNISLHALDVASEKSVQELADALDGVAIDVLIHNAGIYIRGGQTIGAMDYVGWRDAMETNLFGVFRVTEALLENVLASERKQIAAISSSMASLDIVQKAPSLGAVGGTAYQYRSSKTALNMALVVLAKELAAKSVSVVLVDPGWVKTDMGGPNAQLTPEESINGMRRVLAGNPKELAGKFLGYDGRERPW